MRLETPKDEIPICSNTSKAQDLTPSLFLKDCADVASFAAQASPGAGQGEPGDGIVRIDEERGYAILPSDWDDEEDVGLYEELV